MEAGIIRSLILEAKLAEKPSGLKITDITEAVISLAIKKKLLDRRPQYVALKALEDEIYDMVWGLISEGVYTPTFGTRDPDLPHLRATQYGKKCFQAGELTPHDPDQYLARVKKDCPGIDDITLLYLSEALSTFRAGNFLATAVMVGVAAEQTLLRLAASSLAALDTSQKQQKFRAATHGKGAKQKHEELMTRLKSPVTSFPKSLGMNLEQHLGGIYDLIRQTRNDTGHPTGRKLERYETNALLLLFSTYCKTAHELMDWLGKNKI